MSMHEINSVAETITAASDHDANIIFGATISPDLEGEIIVTVVATGFDDAYYTSRSVPGAELVRRAREDSVKSPGQVDDATMANLDMELKEEEQEQPAGDFQSDDTPNIWALPDNNDNSEDKSKEEDEEIDRPSFLRRLRKRASTDNQDSDETSTMYQPDGDNHSDDNDAKNKKT